jgi:uncharacterized protein YgiB involved in biofilm formation
MKRSRTLRLTVMAAAPIALSACQPEIVDPPAQMAQINYPSLQACIDADDIGDNDCRDAFSQARGMAPRYMSEAECERVYGDDACEDYDRSGMFFIPITRGYSVPYGYRTSRQSSYGSIGPIYGDKAASRQVVTVDPPPARAVTASRSGFGSSSSARSGWGG